MRPRRPRGGVKVEIRPVLHHEEIMSSTPTPSKEAPRPSPCSPAALEEIRRDQPPSSVESGDRYAAIFPPKPRVSASERPAKQTHKAPDSSTQTARLDRIRRRSRSRIHHRSPRVGILPPPPLPMAGDSRRATAPVVESLPDRELSRPDASASWAIVPANTARAAVLPMRSRVDAMDPPTRTPDRTPKGSQLRSALTRVGQPTNRVSGSELRPPAWTRREEKRHGGASSSRGPSEAPPMKSLRDGRTKKTNVADQTVQIIRPKGRIVERKKELPDRRLQAPMEYSSSSKGCPACPPSKGGRLKEIRRGTRRRRPDQTVEYPRLRTHHGSSAPQRRPRRRKSGRASSETSRGTRSTTTPTGRASSCSGCCSSEPVRPGRPSRRAAARRNPAEAAEEALRRRNTGRETFSTRRHSSSSRGSIPRPSRGTQTHPTRMMIIPRHRPPRQSPAYRPIAVSSRSKPTGSSAITKGDHRNQQDEGKPKKGRLRRFKDTLGLIFHHHHHHYHHHHPSSDAGNYGGELGGRPHHRSFGELLRGILHHTGRKGAAEGVRRPPQQVQQHGYLYMLLEGLLRHLWRGRKRNKQRVPQPGRVAGCVGVKKLHWWQRIRRRRGVKLASRRRPRLRLGLGRKASVGRNRNKKK